MNTPDWDCRTVRHGLMALPLNRVAALKCRFPGQVSGDPFAQERAELDREEWGSAVQANEPNDEHYE